MKMKQKKKLLLQLKSIPDFRVDKHKIKYPLEQILFLTLLALLRGAVTFKEIHDWMFFNSKHKLYKKLFGNKELNVPTRSTLHRLLINTDNNALEKIFREYFDKYSNKNSISVDGKWLNGSDINGQYTKEDHKAVLNIFDKEKKIVLGHTFLDKCKKSEIPAFQELLEKQNFHQKGQVFSFDALLTQQEILNTINDQENRYIAKVKGNQKSLLEKIKLTVSDFPNPSDSYEDTDITLTENNKGVKRLVEIYTNKDTNRVIYHPGFNHIQTIIKLTKTTTDLKTGVIKTTIDYLIANFKTTALEFKEIILAHWGIETYHYHMDMLLKEDDHIAYKNPFSISIFRSFVVNLYQIYLNDHKGEKFYINDHLLGCVTMSQIKRYSLHDDQFAFELFEQ